MKTNFILESENTKLKEQLLKLAVQDLSEFLSIISEIGIVGYHALKYNRQGLSLKKTAIRLRISKRQVQVIVNKCNRLGYDNALIKLDMLK